MDDHSYHHDDVIKWKHFPRYWPFVRGIHWSPVNSPHKGQWRWALIFSLICAWINGWVNNREAGDLRRHRANYDVTVMTMQSMSHFYKCVWFFENYFHHHWPCISGTTSDWWIPPQRTRNAENDSTPVETCGVVHMLMAIVLPFITE